MMGGDRYHRSIEDVETVIQHAKLTGSDLKPLTQVLTFASEDKFQSNYMFMELDTSLLSTLQKGQSLTFRGCANEPAVLCTKNQTFDVKEAETSNSLLLLNDLKWPAEAEGYSERTLEDRQVLGVFHKYFELRLCKPRLKKLRQLMEESLYEGPECEDDLKNSGVKLYTFEDLLEEVQASEEELRVALKENMGCQINGHWRFLHYKYHFRVLSHILNFVNENSWPVDKVKRVETLQSLATLVPVEVLEQCFLWYTEETGEVDDDGEPLYRLIESKVCRFLAEVLLKSSGKFDLNDFLATWQQGVPEGMETSEKYLEGIALTDKNVNPPVIKYFAETELPEEITQRMRILFQVKEKWTLDEIRPYVERLATDKMNVNALLTKHARASTVGGVRYYSAKHAK